MPDETEEIEESGEDLDCDPTYPDGSVQNECWAERGYTKRRATRTDNDDDLRVLRGD